MKRLAKALYNEPVVFFGFISTAVVAVAGVYDIAWLEGLAVAVVALNTWASRIFTEPHKPRA